MQTRGEPNYERPGRDALATCTRPATRLLSRLRTGVSTLGLGTLVALLAPTAAQAQTFTGTNAPGSFQDFSFQVGATATNLAITLSGGTTNFSDLLLKKGGTPSNTNYDFLALGTGGTNAINLEAPEFTVTNYVLRVRTPTNSVTHGFTVTVATNLVDLRSTNHPATKSLLSSLSGSVSTNAWQYFRLDAPTNLPGWRVVLYSTNTNVTPDVYIQWKQLPTATTYLKRSTNQNPDTLLFTNNEAAAGPYYIGVALPSSTNTVRYTLAVEFASVVTLAWDPGTTFYGTQVYTNTNSTGGDYYFRVTAQTTVAGAWRTALNVVTGEANVYLSRGVLPSPASYQYKSERVGSDGFVLPASAFNDGEDWYLVVRAIPGSQWNLMTGEPFVTDLGTVAADGSSGSGPVPMGAEGMRFFKTMVSVDALAWRLWLNGGTNVVAVKKSSVPVGSSADLAQTGQMLVVPNYLVGGQQFFVGVTGNPGDTITLDSRQQAFTDIPFESSTNLVVTGFPYVTFRVQVPTNQLAWQAAVAPSLGNPNIAIRRSFVPNETNNDAYSEVPGMVTDSVSLVPPTLTDGTFFITVYGTNGYTCTLQSGTPEITEINFESVTVNTDTNRVGWRYFRVSDISQQIGALGWDLFLTNFAPGTRLAVRRNAAPGIWNFRNPLAGSSGTYDVVSIADFLQQPGHQADVWYVGVFNTNTPLGNFGLVSRTLTAETLPFDGGTDSRVSVPVGKWQFFRYDVPADTLGWDVRLINVSSGQPQMVVCREALPTSLAFTGGFGLPLSRTNWPTGNQWPAGTDWTSRPLSSDGSTSENGRILTMGYGSPVQAGTYYVGVLSAVGSSNAMSYTLLSRGIGPNYTIPVQDIDYTNGFFTVGSLGPRDIAVYHVDVPSNVQSWKVKLTPSTGDSLMAVSRAHLPNITAVNNGSVTNLLSAGRKMLKPGNEHFVLLPPLGLTNLIPGPYYFVVTSEGSVGTNSTWIGSGPAGHTFQSLGPMPIVDLGRIGLTELTVSDSLEGGDVYAYKFTVPPPSELLGFEMILANTTGNPMLAESPLSPPLPDPGSGDSGRSISPDYYGNEGGIPAEAVFPNRLLLVYATLDITNDLPVYALVKARAGTGNYPDATYTLRVRQVLADPLPFDGAAPLASGVYDSSYHYFRVDVPTNALGWDLRLVNVNSNSPVLGVSHNLYPIYDPPTWQAAGQSTNWPDGASWFPLKDWTLRSSTADGKTSTDGRIMACGMGQPLEPGTYYVTVDTAGPSDTIGCYSIQSRGIGPSFAIPVTDLDFAAGSATNASLAPREADYYHVVVPPGATSWKVKLTATNGECLLVVLSNSVPNIISGQPNAWGKSIQKTGSEQYVRLPAGNQASLKPGDYYLAVVGEGQSPTNSSRIGTATSSYILQSQGQLQVIDLGTVGSADLVATNALEGGEVQAFTFNVPPGISNVEADLLYPTGLPTMVMRWGAAFPDPGAGSTTGGAGSVSSETYGNEGGYSIASTNGNANAISINVANPSNGVYTLMVKARAPTGTINFSNATYTLVVRSATATPINFDGGSFAVSNQSASTWRYFRVDVPTNALGWDIRLVNVTSGAPKMVVRRDLLPNALSTGVWGTPSLATNWLSGYQWAAGPDWTRRSSSAAGVNEDGRILAMGMGQPLDVGTYYVGVTATIGSTNALSYTVLSRGIGDGMTLPTADLPLTGGSSTNNALPPREAAYYRFTIPSNSPNWKLDLSTVSGEAMLLVLKDRVPSVDTGQNSSPLAGKFMKKAGNEHYMLLPATPQSNITAGTYFAAVVSEGVNPPSATQVGINSSSFVLSTPAAGVGITNLGTVGSSDLLSAETLQGGDARFYQFSVPPGTAALEVRLENRVGNPVMVILTNSSLPQPGALTTSQDTYGYDGGYVPSDAHSNILTVANPPTGTFTVGVKARFNIAGNPNTWPDTTYTVRVRRINVPELNFDGALNTNGLLNYGSAQLLDSERAFFKVVVPSNILGAPVLGWQLDVSQISGFATVRARKDLLPSDAFATGMPFVANEAVLAPPFLTNGTWYVEVRGSNSTSFTLNSSAVSLLRPAWQMPGMGEATTTPGLSAPDFADSGLDTNGVPLPGNQGTDLQQGHYHFYAVTVPPNNGGLMRVQMDSISGNADVYMRLNAVPTAAHATNGGSGTMVAKSLTGTNTEYANWVPINGQLDTNLTTGTWYLGVRASGSANARYRLRLSTGHIQDLDLFSGSVTNQAVSGGDWLYYRVLIPSNAPFNWVLTFNQIVGDVQMYLRDTAPPGNGATTAAADYKDWYSDQKNIVPNTAYDLPGSYSFTVPPIRPGSFYYVGFRAKVDSTFAASSTTTGSTYPAPSDIPFYGGSVSNTLPAFGLLTYRILTPSDALRWRQSYTASNAVQLYLDNGSFPTRTASDDWHSPNSLDKFMVGYPWLPNQAFFLSLTNTSGTPQPFTFTMNGSNTNADDDLDGMPDWWEVKYFGSLSALPTNDNDADGVSNMQEYLDGTDPLNPLSVRPRLTVTATNGTVAINPALSNYTYGATVVVTATPSNGWVFANWSGQVAGTANPLTLILTNSRTFVANFKLAGDDFSQRLPIVGWSNTVTAATGKATKETGEPNHAGNSGGHSLWWTWTPVVNCNVTASTTNSSFNTLLAVYTGTVVSNLTLVSSNDNDGPSITSRLTFAATAGVSYAFAVDGYNGATGMVSLTIQQDVQPLYLSSYSRLAGGQFQFTLIAPAGYDYDILASTNMLAWQKIATLHNWTGTLQFTDTDAPSFARRLYRAAQAGVSTQAPTLLGQPWLSGAPFGFTIQGPPGQSMHILTSSNLVNWSTLTNLTNLTGSLSFTDPSATNFTSRFYRATVP